MFRRGSIVWYVVGAVFLVVAGFAALLGVASPYALPLILVVAGVIVIIAGLFRYRPSIPSLVVFLIGIIVLAVATSGAFGPTQTQTFELTRAQVTSRVDEIALFAHVSTGSLRLSFTSNDTLLYRVVFTRGFNLFFQPAPIVNFTVMNDILQVNASSTFASVDIILNQNLRSSFNLTTSTGGVLVEVPPTAPRVRSMLLTTSTGEVWLNVTNTSSLERITATTTTGQVEAHISSSSQNHNAVVQLRTTTGRVGLDLDTTDIECRIAASTTTGRVNAETLSGFTITTQTNTQLVAQTSDYGLPLLRRLDISAQTTTGSVDISASAH